MRLTKRNARQRKPFTLMHNPCLDSKIPEKQMFCNVEKFSNHTNDKSTYFYGNIFVLIHACAKITLVVAFSVECKKKSYIKIKLRYAKSKTKMCITPIEKSYSLNRICFSRISVYLFDNNFAYDVYNEPTKIC